MAASSEEWTSILTPILSGINRYNPNNIECLEMYVQFQVENPSVYNLEANLSLMKLYQFNPNHFNVDIVCKMLLKSIMALPKIHLALLISVLPLNQQSNEEVVKINSLCSHLESCSFTEFWSLVEECGEIISKVVGFKDAVKNYIAELVNITYQTIPVPQLSSYLGNMPEKELEQFAVSNGWKINDGVVFIRGQEELIKPKRILAKIDFESVSNIISSTR
ncbi:PREDICTED: eukaryotic translation initiation factor 3 subunit K-like [Amphimedon queenslandica]|nr:PREDICTED: eukaryotic translation initiation factor 3 subunit K-like [Amphimedon queenslandica]|eukprot:XP_003389296.1 PREDICTED: eukaryotic translation initiation factor 3 subunit K-like [Amphimedon queenslandica]